jgi:hypothetical protein
MARLPYLIHISSKSADRAEADGGKHAECPALQRRELPSAEPERGRELDLAPPDWDRDYPR